MKRDFIADAPQRAGIFSLFLIAAPVSALFLPLALAQNQTSTSSPGRVQTAEEFPYIIEQYETRVRFENDGTSRRERHVLARVFTEQGARELSRLSFEYDRKTERLEISPVKVLQAGGGSIEVLAHAVSDRPVEAAQNAPAYEDAREKAIRIPAMKAGDRLQYSVTWSVVQPPSPGNFWLDHHFLHGGPVKEETLEISVPPDRELQLKTKAGAEPGAATDEGSGENRRRIYRWKRAQRQPLQKDEDAEPSSETSEPDIQLSTFQSWEEVGRWREGQLEQSAQLDAAVSAKAAEVAKGRATDTEKLAALYKFVSQRIRTIALAPSSVSHRSIAPSQVLANGYGTASDKNLLLGALARTLGLGATLAAVANLRELGDTVAAPAKLDEIVTAVRLRDQFIWLNTGPEVAPFGFLASTLRNKRALVVFATQGRMADQGGNVQWMTIPLDPPFASAQSVQVGGKLSAAGKLQARVQYALRGDAELLLRVAFHRAPREQWKSLGQLLALSDGLRGEITNVTASNPEEIEMPFHVEYGIAQTGAARWKDQKAILALPLPLFGLPEPPEGSAATQGRATPILLGTPLDVTASAKISLPPGVAARAPVGTTVRRDYAEYRSTYSFAGSTIIATRSLRFILRELPAGRAADYAAFAQAVRNDEAQPIALELVKPTLKSAAAPSKKARGSSAPIVAKIVPGPAII